jgi:hypothetical protein
MRNTAGCIGDTPELEQHIYEVDALSGLLTSRPDPVARKTVEEKCTKVYEFYFQQHQYTYIDSARSQSECPHCGATAGDEFGFIDPIKDKDKFYFEGIKKLGEDQVAFCFVCLSCGEHFFYHHKEYFALQLIDEYPELNKIQ